MGNFTQEARHAVGPQTLLGRGDHLSLAYRSIPPIADAPFFTPPLYPTHPREATHPFTLSPRDRIAEMFAQADLRIVWNIAERGANGFRLAQRGEYGRFSDRAMNNPYLAQHNHEHGRRVEAHMEALLGNIPEISHVALPTYAINAAALFPYLHDSDQLDTEQRNVDVRDSLPPKHAHGPGGALKILAQTSEYAKAMGISETEARKITGAAAFMMIKHEEPALLMQALAGGEVLPTEKDPATILEAFENNRLDLARLPVDQLVKILTAKKAEKGFTANTQYGLNPLFEAEYADELAALARDSSPLIPGYTDHDREGLHLLTQVAVFADVFDMIMPAQEAIVRKLGVEKSLRRRFFPKGATYEELLPDVTGEIGNFPDETDSDIARVLWEFEHPLSINDSGIIAESGYVQNLIGTTVIKGVLAFQDVGSALMRGDFSPLAEIFDARIALMQEKLRRKGLDPHHNSRVDALLLDRDNLIAKLYSKFFTNDETHTYSNEDITQFTNIMDQMLKRLQERYGVSDGQVEKYKKDLADGSVSDMPYQAYDSASLDVRSVSGPRTIFPLT